MKSMQEEEGILLLRRLTSALENRSRVRTSVGVSSHVGVSDDVSTCLQEGKVHVVQQNSAIRVS